MINYDTPDTQLPLELRKQIEEASAPHAQAAHKRLSTPVPGNPQGGFPGFSIITEHKQMLVSVRRELIDKWNADNPDHELAVSDPLQATITQEEITRALRNNAKAKRTVAYDHAHAAHIEEVLKEHPEEHHEALREFAKHETNNDGLKPQQYYFRRATAFEAIKAKGKDPHNLMHRYEHHKEMTTNGTDIGN
jgi:hypothetical protein